MSQLDYQNDILAEILQRKKTLDEEKQRTI